MANWKYNIIAITILIIGTCMFCGCNDDDSPSGTGNLAPYQPFSPSPQDGSSNRSLESDLSWQADDPNGDSLYFSIYFSETETLQLIAEEYTQTDYALGTLDPSTTYYWQVVVYDTEGDSTVGPTWTFSTVSGGNNPPNVPSYPNPSSSASDIPINLTLSWTCSDPDFGDFLSYNVYFDTSANPSLATTGISSSSYNPGVLLPLTRYRWRVVAYDNQGDSTAGPTWNFQTGAATEGIYSILSVNRYISVLSDSLLREDELTARFDSVYTPIDPQIPLEAEGITCNEFELAWESGSNSHRYVDPVNLSFITLGETYLFTVSGSPAVPELTDSIGFPATEVNVTSPNEDDTVSIDQFTVTWSGSGSGTAELYILDGSDTTDVQIETSNDGSYTFTADDLEPLGGQSGIYSIVLITENTNLISAPGYDSRSYLRTRIINTVNVYFQ